MAAVPPNNGGVWVGPWGAKYGTLHHPQIPDGERIAGFKIWANSKYVYDLSWLPGPGHELSGDDCHTVDFDEDEYITGFSGTTYASNDQNGSTYVTSLSIITNKCTHGPYGTPRGTPFKLSPVYKGKFVGYFCWKTDGFSGFGAILKPESDH